MSEVIEFRLNETFYIENESKSNEPLASRGSFFHHARSRFKELLGAYSLFEIDIDSGVALMGKLVIYVSWSFISDINPVKTA